MYGIWTTETICEPAPNSCHANEQQQQIARQDREERHGHESHACDHDRPSSHAIGDHAGRKRDDHARQL
jgi:hypothetical protein